MLYSRLSKSTIIRCQSINMRCVVSAAKVKELRNISGAPMLDCKKALEDSEVNQDINKAIDWLRKKGIARATNKSNERIVSEGLIGIFKHPIHRSITIVEVNSETDFVARNQHFQEFVARLALSVEFAVSDSKESIIEPEMLLTRPLLKINNDGNTITTVQEGLGELVSRIRENIVIKRAFVITHGENESLIDYLHGRIGLDNASIPSTVQLGRTVAVLKLKHTSKSGILTEADKESIHSVGRKLGMNVVASTPLYLNRLDIPDDVVARERSIFVEQSRLEISSGKPKSAEQLEKIVSNRLEKRLSELCLMTQTHVAEDDQPIVSKHIDSMKQKLGLLDLCIDQFLRWSVGEGNNK